MIKQEEIKEFISKLPPAPKKVQATLKYLQAGDIPKAAKVAAEDMPLSAYLREIVNKPVYGFKREVKDIAQIFMVLGVGGSEQAIYSYLLKSISPSKWEFFDLNEKLFEDLQAELIIAWNDILSHLGIDDVDEKGRDIENSIALIPSSIVVCEALFGKHKKDIQLLHENREINLNQMLKRISGLSLFDISAYIAKKWELDELVVQIIKASSGDEKVENEIALKYGKWVHLLLFYFFSKPKYIQAKLNDFIEFHVDYVEDIYDEFIQIMGMEE